ncbi:MAG TPA: hypothetical protein VGM32_06590 [Rhodopila sp.]
MSDHDRPRPKLVLHVSGARDDELARGLAAAKTVLDRDGDLDLYAAMAANAVRDFILFDENWEPINDLTAEQHRLARLWEDALGAGLDACRAGWDKPPIRGFWLGIDTGAGTIQPYHAQLPIATFELKDE